MFLIFNLCKRHIFEKLYTMSAKAQGRLNLSSTHKNRKESTLYFFIHSARQSRCLMANYFSKFLISLFNDFYPSLKH